MMQKLLFFIVATAFAFSGYAQERKVRSGIIGGVSMDWFHTSGDKRSLYTVPDKACSFQVGYQLQAGLKHRLSVDAALLYGQKRGKFVPAYGSLPERKTDEKFTRQYIALNGVLNYRVASGLKFGLGVEPTIHLKETVLTNTKLDAAFDIPLVVKAAYSFRHFEVSLAYKNGFCEMMKGAPLAGKTRSRDLQLSVFVPIF